MDRYVPSIPVERRDVGLFLAIVIPIGWLFGDPAATFDVVLGRPPPAAVAFTLVLAWALSPLVAAAILARRLESTGGIRTFLRERFRWRVAVRWYLVAVGLFPALFAVTYAAFVAFVGPLAVDPTLVGPLLVEVLALGILFNLAENFGWRGFLQEALQSRASALAATLGVGVVWGLWHAPLLLPGGQFEAIPVPSYFLVIVGEAVLIGWVYNATDGSVLHAAIAHTSFNASFGVVVFSTIATGGSVGEFYTVTAVAVWIAVAAILYRTDPSTLR